MSTTPPRAIHATIRGVPGQWAVYLPDGPEDQEPWRTPDHLGAGRYRWHRDEDIDWASVELYTLVRTGAVGPEVIPPCPTFDPPAPGRPSLELTPAEEANPNRGWQLTVHLHHAAATVTPLLSTAEARRWLEALTAPTLPRVAVTTRTGAVFGFPLDRVLHWSLIPYGDAEEDGLWRG